MSIQVCSVANRPLGAICLRATRRKSRLTQYGWLVYAKHRHRPPGFKPRGRPARSTYTVVGTQNQPAATRAPEPAPAPTPQAQAQAAANPTALTTPENSDESQ